MTVFLALLNEIKSRQMEFMKAFNSGNTSAAVSLYEPDAYMMPFYKEPVKGRSEPSKLVNVSGIEAYFKQDIAEGVRNVQVITEDVCGNGDWAYERGSYQLDGSLGPETGAYLLVWKKSGGQWYIHADCTNVIKPAKQ
ncbi:unnamed protein product [Enterobius vermicularis]|uniref:DUF4440 domain-containing protein n=1 Tax=Enterobius vermicularis TaxID=51028 RepID=A0A0N4V291_ENTVE|nr:unnamed protein product [Enterobius vermicularis]